MRLTTTLPSIPLLRGALMLLLLLIGGGAASAADAAASRPWDQTYSVATGDTGEAQDMSQSLGRQTTGIAHWIFGPLMWVVVGLIIMVVIVGIALGSARVALYGIGSIFVGVFLITAVVRFLAPAAAGP